ncbi:hypothetical protein ACFL1P_00970 [Patescibacteria group bacterium]
MKKVTISSSLKFKEMIKSAIVRFRVVGVKALFPNLDTGVAKEDITIDFMKKLEKEHFDAIDSSDALYVICPDGYVGTSVSIEIGYAHAHRKPIIYSEKPNDLGLQALTFSIISVTELNKVKYLSFKK